MPDPNQRSCYRSLYEIKTCSKLVTIFKDVFTSYRKAQKVSQQCLIISSHNLFYVEDTCAPHNVRGVVFATEARSAQDLPIFKPILFCSQYKSPATNASWSHIDTLESLFWTLITVIQDTGERPQSTEPESSMNFSPCDPTAMEDKFAILADPLSLMFAAKWERPAMRNLVVKLAAYFQKMLFWRWHHYSVNGGDSVIPGLMEEADRDFDTLDQYFEEALEEIDEEDVQDVWRFVNKSISGEFTKGHTHCSRSGR